MLKRDYLQKQIDQLGKVLTKMLETFLGLKSEGKVTEANKMMEESFRKELGIGLEELSYLDSDQFFNAMRSRNLNNDHLSMLGELFYQMAEELVGEEELLFYQKALLIYEHLTITETTYSLERQFRIDRIKNIIAIE